MVFNRAETDPRPGRSRPESILVSSSSSLWPTPRKQEEAELRPDSIHNGPAVAVDGGQQGPSSPGPFGLGYLSELVTPREEVVSKPVRGACMCECVCVELCYLSELVIPCTSLSVLGKA